MILTKPNMQGGDDKIMTTTVLLCLVYSLSVFVFVCKGKYLCVCEPERVVCVSQMPGLPPMPPMPSMPLPPGMNMMQAMNMMGGPPPIHMGMEPPGMMQHSDRAAQVRHSSVCETLFHCDA